MSLGYKILLYKPYCPCFLEEKNKISLIFQNTQKFLTEEVNDGRIY